MGRLLFCLTLGLAAAAQGQTPPAPAYGRGLPASTTPYYAPSGTTPLTPIANLPPEPLTTAPESMTATWPDPPQALPAMTTYPGVDYSNGANNWVNWPGIGAQPAAARPFLVGGMIGNDPNTWWGLSATARAYFVDDLRIEWSGQEATFGAEGAIAPMIRHRAGDWELSVEGEFYINQPYDRNILVDTQERRSYLANWQPDILEISQLLMRAKYGDLTLMLGKMPTPFGRYYFPLYTNSWQDAPFIRTESILWRETGFLAEYKPGMFVADVAITNGGSDRDANSSKALVARLGLEGENWALGASGKVQDGIGSEGQKEYKNHLGADAMVRMGKFLLSAEAIYDEYGFRRPGYNPNDIFWGRSIYYRDLNYKNGVPITGFGYYGNLQYEGDAWIWMLNYGEFYPANIGVPQQDVVNRRGIAKVVYKFSPYFKWYNVVMLENGGYVAQDNRQRIGQYFLTGLEYHF